MSAYLLVSLHTPPLRPEQTVVPETSDDMVVSAFLQHRDRNHAQEWEKLVEQFEISTTALCQLQRAQPLDSGLSYP